MPITLVASFIFYTILSWVVMFRDERALSVYGKLYPQVAAWLSNSRHWLIGHGLNTIPTAIFLLLIIGSFFLYWRLIKNPPPLRKTIILAIVFQVLVFFSYPILSTDIFSYILSDRLVSVYHQNVWTTKPSQFPNDPFYHLGDWQDQTRIYGLTNQVIYNAAQVFSGDDIILSIATHKLVVLIFSLLTLALMYQLLKKHFPDRLNSGLVLVFFNPLFVLETVGSGHNDILMLFFAVLTFYCFLEEKIVFSAIALALSTQVKTTPLILFVFLLINLVSRKRIVSAVVFLGIYVLLNLISFNLMGINVLSQLMRTTASINVYWQSLPMLWHRFLPGTEKILTLLLLAFLGIQSLRGLLKRVNPLQLFVETILVYLMFFLAAFWNWYALWPLVFTPFLSWGKLPKAVIIYSLTLALAYPLYWTALRFNYQHPIWAVIIYLVIISGPIGFLLYETLSFSNNSSLQRSK